MPFTKGDPNINRKGRIDGGGGLKKYDRDKFNKMTDEEKEEFLKTISNELRYRMAEGNPHQTSDEKVNVEITGCDISIRKDES
jgi:hypothetical protein